VGVEPEEFKDGKPPPGLGGTGRKAIADAADQMADAPP